MSPTDVARITPNCPVVVDPGVVNSTTFPACGVTVPPPEITDQVTLGLKVPVPATAALAYVVVPPGTAAGLRSSVAPPEFVTRYARTEATVTVVADVIVAEPEIAGLATEVAVMTIEPVPVTANVGSPAFKLRVAGPDVTAHVTFCGRPEGLTTAVAVKVFPGAVVDVCGVTTTPVTSESTASETARSANFDGSATDRARTTVTPVVGVAP